MQFGKTTRKVESTNIVSGAQMKPETISDDLLEFIFVSIKKNW